MNVRTMLFLLAGLAAGALSAPALSQTTELRVGLADEPDALDPTIGTAFSVRFILNVACDKLFDLTPDGEITPKLATGYEWSDGGRTLTLTLRDGVRFHDGERFDAAAVKYGLERHLEMPGSFRRPEIAVIERIDVVDDLTVRLSLSQPSSPLLAHLTDRAGMIVSPKAAAALGDKFGTAPVCTGPYKFVERVAQDRIVFERFEDYWDKENIHIDRVTFIAIVNGTVRATNLRSGQLDLIERVSPADLPALRGDPNLETVSIPDLGYHLIRFNVDNGPKSETPLGKDPRVRAAFEAAIDRNVISAVVFNKEFMPGNQYVNPKSYFYNQALPVPPRDLVRAKALMKEAGLSSYSFTISTPNDPDLQQALLVIQAMVAEAGFDMNVQVGEGATLSKAARAGDFEAALSFWGGRIDPDGNIGNHMTCTGAINFSKYCDAAFDRLIAEARLTTDRAERKTRYDAATAILLRDKPVLFLWHRAVLTAYTKKLEGFVPYPDGNLRMRGLKLAAD